MKVVCPCVECKYNGKRNQCQAAKINLSGHGVHTKWEGYQHFWKCKTFELSDRAKEIFKFIENLGEKE